MSLSHSADKPFRASDINDSTASELFMLPLLPPWVFIKRSINCLGVAS